MRPWTLHVGDLLDVLPRMEERSVDAIVSDPPFAFAGGLSNGRTSFADSQYYELWLVSVFRELYRVAKPASVWFLWCDWRTVPLYASALRRAAPDDYNGRVVSQVLIHDRQTIGMGQPFRNRTDFIAVIRGPRTDFGDRIPRNVPNLISEKWPYGRHPNHPAEKSLALTRRLVEWASDEGHLVMDPFAGSATTGIAAIETGRRFVGVEREPAFAAKAKARLARATLERTRGKSAGSVA